MRSKIKNPFDITEGRKNLILEVADGDLSALPILHRIDSMFVRREELYRWFINNKLTGKKFIDSFNGDHHLMLNAYCKIISQIDKIKKTTVNRKELF